MKLLITMHIQVSHQQYNMTWLSFKSPFLRLVMTYDNLTLSILCLTVTKSLATNWITTQNSDFSRHLVHMCVNVIYIKWQQKLLYLSCSCVLHFMFLCFFSFCLSFMFTLLLSFFPSLVQIKNYFGNFFVHFGPNHKRDRKMTNQQLNLV